MKIYTSKEILKADDLYEIQENVCSFGLAIKYQLTDSEIGYMGFVHSKYSIADYLFYNSDNDGILTIDGSKELSKALDKDCQGFGKAVMLSDDTALQKLFFWLYSESDHDEN